MAFDAAQFLRHAIAPDRFETLRSAQMNPSVQQPVETGRAMGMALVVEQNPVAELQDAMEELSMGMSGDYLIAAQEGATHVRIGSAIFGSRSGAAAQNENCLKGETHS